MSAEFQTNIKLQTFEITAGLDTDDEYRRLAQYNYGLICQRLPHNANCTEYTGLFLRDFRYELKNYRVGAMRIGPAHGGSYGHEAIGIAKKDANVVVAVFDPIPNAVGGQLNPGPHSANDRFSLNEWLNYKNRIWHKLGAGDSTKPFSVFLTKEMRNSPRKGAKRGEKIVDYSWVNVRS